MSAMTLGAGGFALLLALMGARIPIGLAMLVIGGLGTLLITGPMSILNSLKTLPYEHFSSHTLSIIPLFLLMGQFAARAGLSSAMYQATNDWLGHRRGGLAMSTIGACGAFGAICGSSLATAATMTQVALPEMERQGYRGSLAAGALAAGGTLGILIPPSVVLVIYAILAEQNINDMFAAALVPGLLAVGSYMLAISCYVRLFPASAPSKPKAALSDRWHSLIDVWPGAAIFIIVIGGIYTGVFTPTEAAAVGAVATGILAATRGGLRWEGLRDCLLETASTTAMIFFIVLGASLFNSFLALTQFPQTTAGWIVNLEISPWVVLAGILLCYLLLGCFMDSLSMILLTVPIFLPIMQGMDFGMSPGDIAIWFGILSLVVVEVGMITPPVGLNIFIIHSMAPRVGLSEIFTGIVPFLIADVVRIILLVAFPTITLGLVYLLY
ncbi:TRAP transporter large permease [Halomonas binhaiensis]|uniref:TRAP transporter large permease protein n=2 Tax=Halomonas binhaiensis TaxID=2562282 RepID=A0A5C1NMJ6_9GAMM|nr:TRAP transporter large permease [Halomonas binhaiensis]QEM84070.1 TRAP transporter large permease [Halomonas binhaiensis]